MFDCEGMSKEEHKERLRKLRDYIEQNKDLFNSMQFHKLYDKSYCGEHVDFFPELNAYITEILYANNISPFSDPKFTHIPTGFAREIFDIPQLENITDATFNNLKVTVGYSAFSDFMSIKSINTSCIEEIKSFGFSSCPELATVTLHGDNITLDNGAFSNCNYLQYFELDVTKSWEIDSNAFSYSYELGEIRVSGTGYGDIADLMHVARHPYNLVISAKTAKNMTDDYKNILRIKAERNKYCTLIIED